jgi:hypothetical protein
MGSLQSNFRWLWAAMKSYIFYEELRSIAKVSETTGRYGRPEGTWRGGDLRVASHPVYLCMKIACQASNSRTELVIECAQPLSALN